VLLELKKGAKKGVFFSKVKNLPFNFSQCSASATINRILLSKPTAKKS